MNVVKRWLIVFPIVLMGLWSNVYGQEDSAKVEISGYIKYLQTTSLAENIFLTDNLLHNRFNLKWYASDQLTLSIGMRNRLFYGEQVKLFNQFLQLDGSSYGRLVDQYEGLVDLSVIWADNDAYALHTIFDRAHINWANEKWDITLGRQRINWGINLAWNPNDVFNPLNFFDFDYEERPGRDALRVQYYPGLFSSIEIAVAPARESKNSIAAALYKFNVANYDIQLLSAYARGDVVFGAGWAGNIGGAGFKGEVSAYRETENSVDTLGNAFTASISFDYQFPANIYGSLGILYNELGANSFENNLFGGGASALLVNNVSAKSLFPAKWAMLAQISATPHPLFSISSATIYSPADNLLVLFPTFTYSIKENWDLDLIIQASFLEQMESYNHSGSSAFFRIKWSY